MRRSNIKKRTKKTSSFYKCYVQPGCNYSTGTYDALKTHTLDHERSNIANGVNDIYFGIIESELANVMPVQLIDLKIVNSEYMIENMTTIIEQSMSVLIMSTIKVVKVQDTCVYYEVYLFPHFERRLIWTPDVEADTSNWPEYDPAKVLEYLGRNYVYISIGGAWLITFSYSYAVVDTEMSELMPISLDPLRMVKGRQIGELFNDNAPESITMVLLHTAKLINDESKCSYFRVNTFPKNEDRIIWYPKPDIPPRILTEYEIKNTLSDKELTKNYGPNYELILRIRGSYLLPSLAAIYSFIDVDLAASEPVRFITKAIINNNQIGKYFTHSADPSSLIFMILDTLKFINKENSILFYEVNVFPNFERRIVTFPLDKFEHLTEEELIDSPLLIYDDHIRCIQSGYNNEMDPISNAKIFPRTTLL